MRADILSGEPFPDYEPSHHTGAHRKLSELQGADPLIVVLSRGSFRPKDRLQARDESLLSLRQELRQDS